MLSPRSILLALLSAPLLTFAQSKPNPFSIPSSGLSATAGQPLQLQWTPTTSGTVSLVLRSGASSDLAAGTIIASNIANSGNYTWSVPSTITRGSDYTVEIVDDSDSSQTNYTPYFVLDSDVTTAYSTSQVTIGAPSSSVAQSTASATGSATSVTAALSSASASASSASASGSSNSTAANSTASSGSSSASGSAMSGSSSMSTSANSGASAASSASAGFQTQSASTGGAPRVTAAAILGMAALGALAL